MLHVIKIKQEVTMPIIRISDAVFKTLESMAVGFDTPQNVIERLIQQTEGVEMMKEETQENQKTGLDVIKQIYPIAKNVFERKYNMDDAQSRLVNEVGMNPNSALMYLQAFQKMMEGVGYKRAINGTATRYYLEMIDLDYGRPALIKALSTVDKHIMYYDGLGRGKLQNIRKIHQEFSEMTRDNSHN